MAGQSMTKPRGDKTQRYVFYLGVVLAAIAAIAVFVAINSADSGGGGGDVPVVVANEAIPADTRITADMIKVEYMSPDKADPDAFTSRGPLVDRVVTEDVAAGATIVTSMVSEAPVTGIGTKVKEGMRALSVEVKQVVTAGGNVKPGDHVDMVGIFEVKSVAKANLVLSQLGLPYTIPDLPPAVVQEISETEGGKPTMVLTVTLLQDVNVLGLDQTLKETTAGGDVGQDVEQPDAEPSAATATLEVTPDHAQMLTTGDEYGILRMDARAVNDDSTPEVQPTLIIVERTN